MPSVGPSTEAFSAAASALGYMYQFRYALLLAVKRQTMGPGWSIAIEAADDLEVSGDQVGDYALVQLKHHQHETNLTDASPDLWKTVRVWSEASATGDIDPRSTTLLLVTTASAPDGSIADALSNDPTQRNNQEIAGRLETIAAKSTNVALRSAFDAFNDLGEERQLELVRSVQVVDGAGDVEQTGQEIEGFARLMVAGDYLEPFVSRLEGWWIRSCLQQLVDGSGSAVRGDMFDAYLCELRHQFRPDNLPIDDDVLSNSPDVNEYLSRAFCQQLTFFDLSVNRVAIAVREYHRAFVQRSRWSEQGLLEYGELDRYERRLQEEWEILFERMREELGHDATEESKRDAARSIYSWAEQADFPIRPLCTEGFVTRGSFHIAADHQRVGWHPDFELLLAQALETSR